MVYIFYEIVIFKLQTNNMCIAIVTETAVKLETLIQSKINIISHITVLNFVIKFIKILIICLERCFIHPEGVENPQGLVMAKVEVRKSTKHS